MADRQFYYVLFHLYCVQNVFGQISPFANVLNFQPIPAYNRNNVPLNTINRQLTNELTILNNLLSRKVPIVNNLQAINSFPINNQLNLNNVPIMTSLNRLPITNNVPNVSPINVIPLNNLPIGRNVPIVSQLNSLPNGNILPVTSLPNFNTMPIANSLPINNIAFNTLPASNLPIISSPPFYNNLALINNLPFNTPPVKNNVPIFNNFKILTSLPNVNQIPIPNNLPVVNNIPANVVLNTLPSYYNPGALLNNYPVSNINANVGNLNYLPVSNLPAGQVYNFANLPFLNNVIQVASPQNYVRQGRQAIQSIPVANECNCNQAGLSMLENKLASSMPSSESLVSLNGLQLGGLGGLGNLPLFNGFPVIGMTESVVNLKPCNCQR